MSLQMRANQFLEGCDISPKLCKYTNLISDKNLLRSYEKNLHNDSIYTPVCYH